MATKTHETNFGALIVFVLLSGAILLVAVGLTLRAASPKSLASVQEVEVGKQIVNVPDWQVFRSGNIWALTNSTRKLSDNYTPSVVEAPVAHTGNDMKVAASLSHTLTSLFAAADKDGVKLMLSSAYRSAADQQAMYSTYLKMNGKQYVQDYVAVPGASEHQTGLAVDLAVASNSCKANASACSLDAPAIAWLRKHAAEYGFIERYPEGKQSITGIAGEHWHYRYVGVPLAKALTNASMTLDEFVQQTAPGYSR